MLELIKLDPLWVEFECPVKDAVKFRSGTQVVVCPAERPDDQRTGTVEYVSMRANAASSTFRVRVTLTNNERVWKAGLKMLIEVPASADRGATGATGATTSPKPSPK